MNPYRASKLRRGRSLADAPRAPWWRRLRHGRRVRKRLRTRSAWRKLIRALDSPAGPTQDELRALLVACRHIEERYRGREE